MIRIKIDKRAEKQLNALPKRDFDYVVERIKQLEETFFPEGCKKLKGSGNYYRIRAGHYRIFYEIVNDKPIVIIIRIANRKKVYRNL